MRRVLFLINFIPLIGISQITLLNTDFADGMDTVRISVTVDPSIDFSYTGANSSWDYSNLTPTSQLLRDYKDLSSASFLVNFMYGPSAPLVYQASNFLSSSSIPLDQISTFLPVTISDVYQYSKNSANSITSVGLSINVDGNEVPFRSDTIETRYELPSNFGDAYNSRGYTNLDMNPFYNAIWRQYRQRSSNVDGWGNIVTPYGTFDVLRIDHFITELDSIYFEVSGFPLAVELPIPDSHIYEWWTNGEKEPILRITTVVQGANETVTNIEYRDIYRGLDAGVDEKLIDHTIFPNPATNELNIFGLNQYPTNYSVVSLEGKTVLNGFISAENNSIDVSALAPGKYQLIIFQNGIAYSNAFLKRKP
jgi:hypothetical protein